MKKEQRCYGHKNSIITPVDIKRVSGSQSLSGNSTIFLIEKLDGKYAATQTTYTLRKPTFSEKLELTIPTLAAMFARVVRFSYNTKKTDLENSLMRYYYRRTTEVLGEVI